MYKTTLWSIALLLACGPGAAWADDGPGPVYGPQTFENLDEGGNAFEESFQVEAPGRYILYVRNGDDESSRVASLAITVNGETVVDAIDLEQTRGMREPVELPEGANGLTVEITGPAGSFVTVAIAPPDGPPVFVHGRLLLPWGRSDGERALALALKNGSPRFARVVRIVFFMPDGSVGATTPRIPIPPRGSLAFPVAEIVEGTDWQFGSVEIFYTGRGTARLFGSARHIGANQSDVQSLEHAGRGLFRARSDK